jgi:hypothetical protein
MMVGCKFCFFATTNSLKPLEYLISDSKIPVEWRIFFTDKTAKEKHLQTVGSKLEVSYVFTRSYCVVFEDQRHEREWLGLVKTEDSVVAVYPERERQGIFYDEEEGNEPKPYIGDEIIIHEVRYQRSAVSVTTRLICCRKYEQTRMALCLLERYKVSIYTSTELIHRYEKKKRVYRAIIIVQYKKQRRYLM